MYAVYVLYVQLPSMYMYTGWDKGNGVSGGGGGGIMSATSRQVFEIVTHLRFVLTDHPIFYSYLSQFHALQMVED